MDFIRWMLIAVEIVLGTSFTIIGFFWALGIAGEQQKEKKDSTLGSVRFALTLVVCTAFWPTAITLSVGWLGPQPHGSFWLTVVAGWGSVLLAFLLMPLGERFGKETMAAMRLLAAITPAACIALAYNFAWLFPHARFPAIDFF
jgi:hypothetical protein